MTDVKPGEVAERLEAFAADMATLGRKENLPWIALMRQARDLIRAQSERERVLVEALGRVELRFDDAEIERLKQRAICGPRSSVVGSGVVLSPTGNVLCTCPQQSDAELIAKLWNGARK